jgi:predicted O-methyltransferase YrrM
VKFRLGKNLYPAVFVNYATEKFNLYSCRGRLASAILNKKAEKCKDTLEFIQLTNQIFARVPEKYIGSSIKPAQVISEIQALLNIVHELKVHTMLEIGSFNGGTLFLFTRMIEPNANIVSLDMPGARFGKGVEGNEKFKIPFFTNFARDNQKISLIRGNSHLTSSFSKVKAALKGHSLDFLFIDGDHTYEGVKKDFEMYRPLVRRGGVVAFHDICKHPPKSGCDVHSFWNEVKRYYPHKEFISDPNQSWAGIGVLYL